MLYLWYIRVHSILLVPKAVFVRYFLCEVHFCGTLTHWGRVTHICVGKVTIIGSNNGLLPGRRQTIIWTNAGILLIWPLGTNFSEILIAIETFSLKKMHLKISSAKWRPFCLGLNVLRDISYFCWITFIWDSCHIWMFYIIYIYTYWKMELMKMSVELLFLSFQV